MVRKFAGALLALALVGGIVVAGPVAPSYAATTPDFSPSGNSAKKYLLNILGSVLGGAMPNKWRAEQIANDFRYDHSYEALNARFGYSSRYGDGSPMPVPGSGTYDDYMIAKAETALAGKPFTPPATKTQKFVKTIGGAATAFTGYAIGSAFGSGVVDLFFEDVNGQVCKQDADNGNQLLSLITSRDCSAFAAAAEYAINSDRATSRTTAPLCTATGLCFSLVGEVPSYSPPLSCWTYTGSGFTSGSGPIVAGVSASGAELNSSNFYTSGGRYTGCEAVWPAQQAGASTGVGPVSYRLKVSGAVVATQPVVEVVPDPPRTFECSVLGSDGLTYTAKTAEFTEAGQWQTPVCPPLPSGVAPSNTTIKQKTGGTEVVPVFDEDTTPEFLNWWTAYPECRDGSCKLDLVSVPDVQSCFEMAEGACADWFTDPNKATLYQCRYGDHDVALEECNVYARVFQPAAVTAGSAYADPTTGLWSGGQSSPAAASGFMGSTVQDPEAERQCLPQGWAVLNPVEWVLRPVQCALEWAFVPRPAVTAFEAEAMKAAWDGTSVVQIAGVATTFGTLVGSVDGDCQGPPVTFPASLAAFGLSGTWYPLTACEGVPATLAGISRASAVAAVGLAAVFAMMHFFGVSIGFVGMGRGRDS